MAIDFDIQRSFRGGQNFNDTERSSGTTYLQGVNVLPERDDLIPRYPYKKINIDLGRFSNGNPQAMIPLSRENALILIINGHWLRVDLSTNEVNEIEYEQFTNKIQGSLQVVNWTLVEGVVVVYDGDLPLRYEGNKIFRSDQDREYIFTDAEENIVTIKTPELIRGELGYFNQLRIWQKITANSLIVSDPVGLFPGSPFTVQESFTDDGEFTGQFPTITQLTSDDQITAIGDFLSQAGRSTTVFGELFVATKDYISAIASEVPRTAWESTAGFIRRLFTGKGIAGQLAWDHLNYDLGFIDPNGRINSLFINSNELQRWATTDIDREVTNYIKTYNPELYQFSTFKKFNKIALATSYPYYTERFDDNGDTIASFAFKGFLVLSLYNQSGLSEDSNPTWAGLWTGVNPIFFTTIGNTGYILSDDNGQNVLYSMQEGIGNDEVDGIEKQIRSRITLGRFGFRDQGFVDKNFKSVDLSFMEISKKLSVKVDFKMSENPSWYKIGCKTFDYSKEENCCNIDCNKPYFRNYKMMIDPSSCEADIRFKTCDLRISFKGPFRFKYVKLRADTLMDNDSLEFNDQFKTVTIKDEVSDYDFYTTRDSLEDKEIDEFTFSEKDCKDNC